MWLHQTKSVRSGGWAKSLISQYVFLYKADEVAISTPFNDHGQLFAHTYPNLCHPGSVIWLGRKLERKLKMFCEALALWSGPLHVDSTFRLNGSRIRKERLPQLPLRPLVASLKHVGRSSKLGPRPIYPHLTLNLYLFIDIKFALFPATQSSKVKPTLLVG